MKMVSSLKAKVVGLALSAGVAVGFCLPVFAEIDYTTPDGLMTYLKTELVTAFSTIVPFVVWALMLILGYGVCLWAIGKVRSLFGGKKSDGRLGAGRR